MATSCADVREMVIEKALYAEVEVVVAVALLNARLANRRQGHTCKEVPLSREKSCFLTEPLFVSRKPPASRWIRTFTARGIRFDDENSHIKLRFSSYDGSGRGR